MNRRQFLTAFGGATVGLAVVPLSSLFGGTGSAVVTAPAVVPVAVASQFLTMEQAQAMISDLIDEAWDEQVASRSDVWERYR